ncbi:MAG: CHAD domain-containing protein [Vicinamibacterales bacterium]
MRTSPSELLIRQRFAALRRSLPAAAQGNAERLHQARVATRRLRETLPLVASGKRERKLERRVRRLTRALGPVRELDVALGILDDLEGTADAPRGAIARLRRAIADERERLHAGMRERIAQCDLRKLEKRAINASQGGTRKAIARPEQAEAARRGAARRAARLRDAIDTAAGLYLPDRLHDVRIAVKKLRYALEISGTVAGTHGRARLRALKQAQDLLGRMHDLEVLIARIRGIQGSASAPPLKVSADLDRLVRRLENECRQLHGHYSALRKPLLAICRQVRAAAPRGRAAA